MRIPTKGLLAFGLIASAATLTIPAAGSAKAQGFYVEGPGIHVWVGDPHDRYYRHRYRQEYGYDYDYGPRYRRGYGAYAADPDHPYGYNYNYGDPRCGIPNYTIQDGVCKPYTGR